MAYTSNCPNLQNYVYCHTSVGAWNSQELTNEQGYLAQFETWDALQGALTHVPVGRTNVLYMCDEGLDNTGQQKHQAGHGVI